MKIIVRTWDPGKSIKLAEYELSQEERMQMTFDLTSGHDIELIIPAVEISQNREVIKMNSPNREELSWADNVLEKGGQVNQLQQATEYYRDAYRESNMMIAELRNELYLLLDQVDDTGSVSEHARNKVMDLRNKSWELLKKNPEYEVP